MKKHSNVFYVLIFVMAQIAWFFLLGLWIYWYVTNYILLEKGGIKIYGFNVNLVALISGLALLVVISVAMSLIFMYLNRQMNLTRMYDNFIANITHELKSPLSSIQLFLETMKSRNVGKEKQKEFISSMLDDVNRLNSLINSILYISGFESSKTTRRYPHNYQVYEADDFLKEVIADVASQLKIRDNVEIRGSAPCKCVLDKQWIGIVFHNIMDNAKKYSTGVLKIEILFKCTDKFVVIDIKDNGIGIPRFYRKRIFNKFERVDNPDSPSVKGTGLGLYWVKEIIDYHGGDISVSSEGQNMGATFTIRIPIYMATKRRYIKNLLKLSNSKKQKVVQ